MTKVIILGEEPKGENKPKSIEFVKFISANKIYEGTLIYPNSFKNIELVCRNYLGSPYDLMFAYNDDRDKGNSYLGFY